MGITLGNVSHKVDEVSQWYDTVVECRGCLEKEFALNFVLVILSDEIIFVRTVRCER